MNEVLEGWLSKLGKLLAIVCAGTLSSPVSAATDVFNILSIPASSPLPMRLSAEVEFISDGYQMERCVLVASSGDANADVQACKTVSFKNARKPLRAMTPVWGNVPAFENYVMPAPKTKTAAVTPYDYPSESIRKNEQGTTVLRIDVNETGVITRCDVAASSGYKRLDDIARAGFCRRMKLHPAYLEGTPVASVNLTTIKFYVGA